MNEALKELNLEEFTEQLNEARKNGHSLPSGNGKSASLRKWIPKKWKPVYSEIVLLSCAGWKNTELAKKYDYTEVQISNILNTPQAALLRRRVLEDLQGRAIKSIPAKLEQIAQKTVDRLKTLLDDDEKFDESPFSVIDRGLKVLQGTGHLKRDEDDSRRGGVNVRNAVILTKEHSDDLIDGLKRAKEAELLNPAPPRSHEEPYLDQETIVEIKEELKDTSSS